MKRLKIVFGGAALLLAGFGAYATTSNMAPNTYWYFTAPGPDRHCTDVTVNFDCDSNVVPCEGTSGASLGQQLYLTSDCDQPLKKQQ